jgi:hypothetical protein
MERFDAVDGQLVEDAVHERVAKGLVELPRDLLGRPLVE